jgi:hypothetical protein
MSAYAKRAGGKRSNASSRKHQGSHSHRQNLERQSPRKKALPRAASPGKTMDLAIEPRWEQIENVRKKTHSFLKTHGLSVELTDALTMVGSELVENGVKYGSFEHPDSKLRFKLKVSENSIVIEVTHPTDPSASHHLRRLDKTIQWIRGYQDPFQAYLERIKEVARKPIHDHESGLGLVRIAYEGKSILDFFVAEDDALNVSAIAGIQERLWR